MKVADWYCTEHLSLRHSDDICDVSWFNDEQLGECRMVPVWIRGRRA